MSKYDRVLESQFSVTFLSAPNRAAPVCTAKSGEHVNQVVEDPTTRRGLPRSFLSIDYDKREGCNFSAILAREAHLNQSSSPSSPVSTPPFAECREKILPLKRTCLVLIPIRCASPTPSSNIIYTPFAIIRCGSRSESLVRRKEEGTLESKISEILDASAYLKLENLQPSHSFKYRGVSLFVQRAKETHGPSVHLVAASSGNAGLAAACTANALHVKCSVYLPEGATQSTVDILRRQNAEVIAVGRHYAEAAQAARAAVEREPGAVLVPAYDHETLWEGHGSMIEEISTQLGSKPDAIFCSVGGGGLLGGIITGCKKVCWDDVPIVALETIGCNCFFHSMSCNAGRFNHVNKVLPPDVDVLYDEKERVTLARFDKFTSRASTSLGASQPSAKVVKMALERKGGTKCVSVPDELAMQALVSFADDHKLLVELACATTLTPAYKPALFEKLAPATPGRKRTVIFVLCGGFKASLNDALECRKLMNEDVAKGVAWTVLLDDGNTFEVEK
ncbi:putative pyridoxal-phosphate dependent enzyme [Lyophyllum shimeji]|uniref:L-serine ammonia-lyase n=1 Tax=Lyophyllum shimeji TaxID=47721 RepID=A0A9P3PKK2_LYOSH|nr:putative pyridoxal-phosphate dependent enzyme [Lyophyllum shimeji]